MGDRKYNLQVYVYVLIGRFEILSVAHMPTNHYSSLIQKTSTGCLVTIEMPNINVDVAYEILH